MSVTQHPLPPAELAGYVGHRDPARRLEDFERFGRRFRREILDLLPDGWSFEGKRVLDFGCGPGRVLRHFLDEARSAEMHGCDVDARSMAWLEEHLSPPLHVLRNEERPPLPYPDGHFDLIWAISVFSVLTDSWSAWMCELHRLLRRDGILIASFIGEAGSELVAGEPWDEERIGMNVLGYGERWEAGGPIVLHSPWWLRAHWGRAFDVVELKPRTENVEGMVGLRKRDVTVTPEQLERVEPGDERELQALRHNLVQVQRETVALRDAYNRCAAELDGGRLREERDRLLAQLRAVAHSRSWRLTGPLRRLGRLLRRGRR